MNKKWLNLIPYFVISVAAIVLIVFVGKIPLRTAATGTVGKEIPKIESAAFIIEGNPDANVTIVEFYDPACPYSFRFDNTTLPLILEKYVNTGKVRLVIRAFPLERIHPNAFDASMYLDCVYAYTNLSEYLKARKLLYIRRREWMHAAGDNLTKILLNTLYFDESTYNGIVDCYLNKVTAGYVRNDYMIGRVYGVIGTPSIVIVVPKELLDEKELTEIEQHFARIYNRNYTVFKDPYGRYLVPLIGALPFEEIDFILQRVFS